MSLKMRRVHKKAEGSREPARSFPQRPSLPGGMAVNIVQRTLASLGRKQYDFISPETLSTK